MLLEAIWDGVSRGWLVSIHFSWRDYTIELEKRIRRGVFKRCGGPILQLQWFLNSIRKSRIFKFVSGEKRRPSKVQRQSRSWRLPGTAPMSADFTWIRKWLERIVLFASATTDRRARLDSRSIAASGQDRARTDVVTRPIWDPTLSSGCVVPSSDFVLHSSGLSFLQAKENWRERLLPRPSTQQTLTHYVKFIFLRISPSRGVCRAKGHFSRLVDGFWCGYFFLFESYLKCKSKEVRNNQISLGEFLKNPKMCSKDGVRRQIDLNLRTSQASFYFWNMRRKPRSTKLF